MNPVQMMSRIKNMLVSPKSEWPVAAAEPASVASLFLNFILIVSVIPPLFGLVKGVLIGTSIPLVGTIRLPLSAGIITMVLTYGMALVSTFLVALIINLLAGSFGGEKNLTQAVKTAAYAYSASWVAGVLVLVPWVGWVLALAGSIYSIYLMYLGLPHTMKCPPNKAGGYTAVVVVIAIVLGWILAAVVGIVSTIAMVGKAASGMGTLDLGGSTSETVATDPDSALGSLARMGEQMEDAAKQAEASAKSGDTQGQVEAAGQVMGALLGGGDQVEALAPAQIQPFLPATLGGLSRTSVSTERNAMLGVQISTGEASYSDDEGSRSLRLEIVDTGGAKGAMAFAGFAMGEREQQSGENYEKSYREGGRLVQEEWDAGSRSGKYALVLADRFAIKIDGQGFEMQELKAIAGSLDLAGLEALKMQGVKAR